MKQFEESKLVSFEDMANVFYNVETIFRVHTVLLAKINESVKEHNGIYEPASIIRCFNDSVY
jgi:hypothetical protein